MRTTLDLPDELLRHLKARAALQGCSLRDLTLELIERGLRAPARAQTAEPPATLPTVHLGQRMRVPKSGLSHAALSELAQD